MGTAFQALRFEGVGRLLMEAERLGDGIAIHYSMPSVHAAGILGLHASKDVDEDAGPGFPANRDGWAKGLTDVGLSYDFVSYEQVEKGGLDPARIKVFILVRDVNLVWLVYVANVLLITSASFFLPATNASIPNIVSQEELFPANALSGATWGIMVMVGSALGGIVSAIFGRDIAFVVNAEQGSFQGIGDHVASGEAATDQPHGPITDKRASRISRLPVKRLDAVRKPREKQ